MSDVSINTTIDDIFRSTPLGSFDNAIGSVFHGINHRQTPNPVPINKDGYGLTFWTRPQLNMTTENIRAERSFIPLLTKESRSIQRMIRCYLDPRLIASPGNNFFTPVMDNRNAFMPLLTNHCLSCSGWPEPTIEQFTSKPGVYKEVYSMTDSNMDIYSAYDITATFRNMESDPITLLFYTWVKYQALVFEGILAPYPDMIVKNEIDYNSRIYRLVLDKTKRYVQKIACTGVATPVTSNISAAFNFSNDKPYTTSSESIDIQFKCLGIRYNDDIVVHDFNKVVSIFNGNMAEDKIKSNMIKIPREFLEFFNNKGYPRIEPNTMELNWYIEPNEYNQNLAAYTRNRAALKL